MEVAGLQVLGKAGAGAIGVAALEAEHLEEAAAASLRYGFRCSWLWFLAHGRITQTVGLFFLGILVGRHRLLYNEGNNLKIWRVVPAFSLAAVLAGSVFGAAGHGSVHFGPLDALLWYGFAGFRRSLTHICFFGRMSLTNYLLSSLIGSFLFYGWGLALYKELGVTWSFLVGIGIVTFQILILRLWARKHPRGPLETIWRKLTWL